MLDRIKVLLGIIDDSKDAILNILIEEAISEALVLTDIALYDIKLDSIVCRMTIFKYNRMGQDGLLSQSYSGASESYTEGYPEDIKGILRGFRKVKFL